MIVVIIAQGFEEIEAIVPVDILRRAGIDARMFGVGSKSIQGGHGIVIECDEIIDNLTVDSLTDDVEGVVVPGGHNGALNIARSSACNNLIVKLNKMEKMIAAICAAPAIVLEPLNILSGRSITCYPAYQDSVSSGRYQNSQIAVDKNIITAQAAGSALQFAQEIVSYIKSLEEAKHTMNKIHFVSS